MSRSDVCRMRRSRQCDGSCHRRSLSGSHTNGYSLVGAIRSGASVISCGGDWGRFSLRRRSASKGKRLVRERFGWLRFIVSFVVGLPPRAISWLAFYGKRDLPVVDLAERKYELVARGAAAPPSSRARYATLPCSIIWPRLARGKHAFTFRPNNFIQQRRMSF